MQIDIMIETKDDSNQSLQKSAKILKDFFLYEYEIEHKSNVR